MSGQYFVRFFDNEAHAGHLIGETELESYIPILPDFMRLLGSFEEVSNTDSGAKNVANRRGICEYSAFTY